MKKVFLTLTVVASLFITSCNKNDDDSQDQVIQDEVIQDEIIGTWNLNGDFATENGQITDKPLNSCQQKSFIKFSTDGGLSSKSYSIEENNACFLVQEFTGTWKNIKDSIYEATLNDGIRTALFDFILSGNTITHNIEFEDEDEIVSIVYQKQ